MYLLIGTPSEIAEFMDKQGKEDVTLRVAKVSFDTPYKSVADMLKEAEYLRQAKRYGLGDQI